MAYKKVKNIDEVSCGLNYVTGGAVAVRIEDNIIYMCVEETYYKFSKEGFETGNHISGKLFEYGSTPRNIYGRFIAFKVIENNKPSLYIAICSKDKETEHEPIMIYSESFGNLSEDSNSKIVNFCFKPKREKGSRLYSGSIGWISEDIYYTVFNKSRLLEKAIPKCDYVKKAEVLKRKIEKCQYIPMAYSREHEDIEIYDVFPQEMNKLYFLSKLKYMIENYSSTKIYYSQSLKRLEEKYKAVLSHFKYNDIAS